MFISILISIFITLAICSAFFLFWRRRVQRELETDAVAGKLRREVEALITDLNGTTERNVALIEDSLQKGRLLIERAEEAAVQLRQETQKNDLSRNIHDSLKRSRLEETVIDWKGSGDSSEKAIERIDTAVPPPSDKEIESINIANLSNKDKVLIEYRRGESPDHIASSLGISRGEVELIISVHDRKRQV